MGLAVKAIAPTLTNVILKKITVLSTPHVKIILDLLSVSVTMDSMETVWNAWIPTNVVMNRLRSGFTEKIFSHFPEAFQLVIMSSVFKKECFQVFA